MSFKASPRLTLPLSPSHKHTISTSSQAKYSHKSLLPLAATLGTSPYASRSLKNSPRPRIPAQHRSPPYAFSPTSHLRRNPSLASVPPERQSPQVTKLGRCRQLLEEVISRNTGCAQDLKEIKAGYEELLRQTEAETVRIARERDYGSVDSLEDGFCQFLIQENQQLAAECQGLRRLIQEAKRENDRYKTLH